MKSQKRLQAADIISKFFRSLGKKNPNQVVLVSGHDAGRKMVEIYRLLTEEMPQSPGIDDEFVPDETPAVEWASPSERDPNTILYVLPGDPDIIQQGDQNDREGKEKTITDGGQERNLVRRH